MDNNQWWVRYTVGIIDKVREAQAQDKMLWTSAPKAELIALRRSLVVSPGKKVYIYTDSKYAFIVVHAHEAIWKERRLLTLGNKDVKHAEEILRWLEAVELLNLATIIHCTGHQRDSYQTSQGNQTADKAGRQAAGGLPHLGVLIPCLDLSKFKPHYIERDEECDWWGFTDIDPNSIWKINTHGMILLHEALVYPILKHLHKGTHYGRDALMDLIRPQLKGPHLQRTIQRITQASDTCQKQS